MVSQITFLKSTGITKRISVEINEEILGDISVGTVGEIPKKTSRNFFSDPLRHFQGVHGESSLFFFSKELLIYF